MSQQALDLPRAVQTVRRHRNLVGIMAVLGLLIGAAYATLHPPMFTGTALILLPQDLQSAQPVQDGSATGNSTIDTLTSVQVVVAGSDPVLSGALQNVSPPISFTKLRSEVKVTSTTSGIISISAKGMSPAEADATANAVADSYAAYVAGKNTPVYVVARVLQRATNATGSSRLYDEMQRDLRRPHAFARERVGLAYGRLANARSDRPLILLTDYVPLEDDRYLPDRTVGARIDSEAIRSGMQGVLKRDEGCFHVHLHQWPGRLAFSGTDRAELPRVAMSFRNVGPQHSHGLLLLSDDLAYAEVWMPGSRAAVAARINIVGFPMSIIEA